MNTFKKTVSGITLKDLVTGSLLLAKESDHINAMPGGICNRTISEYIIAGNIGKLKNFLDTKHVNIEDKDEDGNTPLMIACIHGRMDVVALLLARGSDVNAENEEKLTPLHIAAGAGHVDICIELLDAGAAINAMDVGHWTPYIWACYRGRTPVVEALLARGADVNAKGIHHVSGLVWAAGRGRTDLVRLLVDKHIKIDVGDRYGTTALTWAARKGRQDIVEILLKAGASVDAVGMYSWTPLLVATMGNYVEVVNMILDHSPNVNAVDKDGMTALAIASKEGFEEIAAKLISVGAYINLQDRAGDTNLIHATKAAHVGIVEALLKKFADVNIRGKDQKTCLHWAIDKNHAHIAKLILSANPDLEAKTVDGDTPLLRAVRGRNGDIVQMLLDKKAKIHATDRKGDTALHIAMRARSKTIVEILLRNPKHSQLLYRPNRQGETPYSIDMNSPKTILGQVFGARRLNTNEDSENILGYDLYSSALADILTEPSLSMPITVGLYAKWGSGKSFLLGKLRQEMKSFTREWVDPTFHMSPLLFFMLLQITILAGVLSWVIAFSLEVGTLSIVIGVCISVALFVFSYIFVFAIWKSSFKYEWITVYNVSVFLAKHFNSLKLVLNVMFCHPPGNESPGGGAMSVVQPLRLFFTDQTRVITSTGGENSVTLMIGSLLDEIEDQYGKVATRLFRALRPEPKSPNSSKRWRRSCCIPYIFLYLLVFFGTMATIILLCLFLDGSATSTREESYQPWPNMTTTAAFETYSDELEKDLILGFLIASAALVGVILIANLYTLASCFQAMLFSHRRHLQRAVAKLDLVKSEGYLQVVKTEVNIMLDMVKCLDAFTGQQSRLVVVVDGLDSCEQTKVLSVLDAVHMLLSDPGAPFIIILAIDPHVITKAIELNLNQAFSQTSIGGDAYIRNMVHLPFFLQNSGLRKVKVAQQMAAVAKSKNPTTANWLEVDDNAPQRKLSTESSLYGGGVRKNKYQKRYTRSRQSDSIASSIGSNLNRAGGLQGPQDLTKVLLNDDYFNDVNPRSMRRLMNVVYVMGRLLKAFHIDFNWYHLATWVNITEQWPYRLSWIILFSEMHEEDLEEGTALKAIYDKVKCLIPTQKELEPLLELDRDEKKLDTFLSYHKKQMTLIDLRIFLPFTINLDPYVKKVIKEEIQNMEEMGLPMGDALNLSERESNSHRSHHAPPLLTRRQAAKLTKQMSFPDNNPMLKTPFPMIYQQQAPMWPYPGPMPSFPSPAIISEMSRNLNRKNSMEGMTSDILIDLPDEIRSPVLSQKTLDEVCAMLRAIRGITQSMLDNYCNTITAQNLSGTVLANCSLGDLKSVINMNFGDWELFRLLIQTLRTQEKNHTFTASSEGGAHGNYVEARNLRIRRTATPEPTTPPEEEGRHLKARQYHQTTLEKQVTMEDAMISGLLSTLNEEAQEDIISEEIKQVENYDENDVGESMSEGAAANQESDVVYLSHTSPANSTRVEHLQTDAGIEGGGSSTSWFNNSRVLVSSVGGSSSISCSRTGSQSSINPTSPVHQQGTSRFHPQSLPATREGSRRRRARHLRDRLNSASGGAEKNVAFSLSDDEEEEEDDEDPYAWLSRTAPASPLGGSGGRRKRSKAELLRDSDASLTQFPLDYEHHQDEEHQRGSGWLFDPSVSMERLGETSRKVKKRLRHALQLMESGAVPAVQRARRPSTSSQGGGGDDVMPLVEKQGLFQRLASSSKKSSVSSQQRLSVDEGDGSSQCSSPEEQQTVAKRPSMTSSRGPHVQELFTSAASNTMAGEKGDIVTTVLPDGQIMTAAIAPPKEDC